MDTGDIKNIKNHKEIKMNKSIKEIGTAVRKKREKIEKDLEELELLIADLRDILSNNQRVLNIIKEESLEIRNKYGDERRTNIDMSAIDFIEDEALIPVEDIVITLTNNGYIKRITSETYKIQNRGGVGVKGMATNEEDFVKTLISMTTHDYLMIFTNIH